MPSKLMVRFFKINNSNFLSFVKKKQLSQSPTATAECPFSFAIKKKVPKLNQQINKEFYSLTMITFNEIRLLVHLSSALFPKSKGKWTLSSARIMGA
jgi:hypothetical protein